MTEEEIARRKRSRAGLIFGIVLFAAAFAWGTTGGGAAFADQQPAVSVVNPGGTPVWGGDPLAQVQTKDVQAGATLVSEFAVMNAGAVGANLDITINGQDAHEQYVHATLLDESSDTILYRGALADAKVRGYHIGLGTTSQRIFQLRLDIDADAPDSIRGALLAPTISVDATAAH